MSPLETIHVIDFEGNRNYGILEYALVTLKNSAITNVASAKCCQNPHQQTVHFMEHSRFIPQEKDTNFKEYLPFFVKKRTEGLFCAHGASVEDRLLRQYCPTPGTITPPPERQIVKNWPKPQYPATATKPMESISWGPWIDTYKIYRKYYPTLTCYEVASLIRHFGLEKKLENLATKYNFALTFHRAPYDALATALLLQNFIGHFSIKDIQFLLNH
jgi:hypothetical protein